MLLTSQQSVYGTATVGAIYHKVIATIVFDSKTNQFMYLSENERNINFLEDEIVANQTHEVTISKMINNNLGINVRLTRKLGDSVSYYYFDTLHQINKKIEMLGYFVVIGEKILNVGSINKDIKWSTFESLLEKLQNPLFIQNPKFQGYTEIFQRAQKVKLQIM